jgi:DNA-binding beta-propeller fold protein YncE
MPHSPLGAPHERSHLAFRLAATLCVGLSCAACDSAAPDEPAAEAPGPTTEVTAPRAGAERPPDAGAATEDAAGPDPAPADGLRDVLLVGNSVSGSVSFVDPETLQNLGSVDVIPDLDAVMLQIRLNPVRLVAYEVIKNQQLLHHFEPQNGDRFVDDVFVSRDGGVLYVSRSNLGDVAAFDLTKPDHPQLWRTRVDGLKADHAALSPDGERIVVSATTAQVANVIDAKNGKVIATFPTGYYPHQNDYSHDGRFIYNASIGNVGYNAVSYEDNDQKGDRWLTKVDATTYEVVKTWPFEFGIRPAVFSADDTIMFSQLSYLNGLIKFDLEAGREVARSDQPLSEFALSTYATYDEYPHDSAHHGLAMSGDGKKLCDCGTIDNTVSIVATDDLKVLHTIDIGYVPYWATTSPDGKHCFVSISGGDSIAVIDYDSGAEVAEVPVGRFPQRSRLGRVQPSVIDGLSSDPG